MDVRSDPLGLVLTDPRRHGGIPSETRREYVHVGLYGKASLFSG